MGTTTTATTNTSQIEEATSQDWMEILNLVLVSMTILSGVIGLIIKKCKRQRRIEDMLHELESEMNDTSAETSFNGDHHEIQTGATDSREMRALLADRHTIVLNESRRN